MSLLPHITICLCTYRRPELLAHLLARIDAQKTGGLFTYSLVIVDNDSAESARETVAAWAQDSRVQVSYHVEPEQSIALARNAAVAQASGDYLAFVDDDESPIDEWLLLLYSCLQHYRTDGVFGPVEPQFASPPPEWAVKGGVFERPRFRTGDRIHWRHTGTGNVLLRRSVVEGQAVPFRPEFGSGGEDVDFFRRAMIAGNTFVWCEEALVHETISAQRTQLAFQVKRALLRGKVALSGPAGGGIGVLKSVVVLAVYVTLSPVFLALGRPVFLKYLIRACDHLGKIIASVCFSVIREKYVVK